LGADPAALARRQAFGGRWERLSQATADGAVPAIGDEATVRWALGKRLGDTLPYSDERGQTFQLRIVDVLPNSILQGSLIIAESSFNGRFPSAAGYRVFLLDAVPAEWARSLADRGFEAVPAWRRLAEFAAVENTYLAIFQALGGLGLVLGSVGLAIVVWRNVLERRGELALLQAVGFERRALRRLVVFEHWLLVALGIGTGLVAALVAVGPTAGLRLPVGPLVLLAVGGLAWSWLAAAAALRGPLVPALRNE
jgi:ABC-type antimicrobial peptide transport system permease subunit